MATLYSSLVTIIQSRKTGLLSPQDRWRKISLMMALFHLLKPINQADASKWTAAKRRKGIKICSSLLKFAVETFEIIKIQKQLPL